MIAETYVFGRGSRIKKQSLFKFSPDGKLFAVNRGTHVELWSINQERDDVGIDAQGIFKGLADVFLLPVFDENSLDSIQPSLDFSKDGKILAASFGSIVVYDLHKKKSLWSYNLKSLSYQNLVDYAALHPNGELLFIYTDKVGTVPNIDDPGVSLVNLKQKR
jgi:WD40 repeat protein